MYLLILLNNLNVYLFRRFTCNDFSRPKDDLCHSPEIIMITYN